MLISLGYGCELGAALDDASGSAGGGAGEACWRRRSRVPDAEAQEQAGTRQGHGAVQPSAAVDSVQEELYRCIRRRHEDGSLQAEWELWELGKHLNEWLLLATATAGDTRTSAVLSVERTPGLYNIFIDMLFIGLSDNTRCAPIIFITYDGCYLLWLLPIMASVLTLLP